MPFMANKIDHETGRLVVDCSNADEVKQRAPDWTRQAALAAYLAQPERKFGPIMAVISPKWVEDPEHGNWDGRGRALATAAEFTPIEPSGIQFIRNVKTPTLVLVGEYDAECPAPQSYEFWHALRTLRVPTQLVVYAGEGHLFMNPTNRVDMQDRTVAWFDKYLK
jgi:pimeloyl-ACP methyl ester carboxylesterase